MNGLLYRDRTFDEWKALSSEVQVSIARGSERAFGYVADEQATRDAALGAAVRAQLYLDGAEHAYGCQLLAAPGAEMRDEVAIRLLLAIADALAAETVGEEKEAEK